MIMSFITPHSYSIVNINAMYVHFIPGEMSKLYIFHYCISTSKNFFPSIKILFIKLYMNIIVK